MDRRTIGGVRIHALTPAVPTLTACLIGLFLALGPGRASAGPIRAHRLAHPARSSPLTVFGPAWARFLAGGPALWAVEHAPRFPAHLRLATQNGLLVATPFVEYLTWRR